ncbi:MAG: low-specificity L-threonine aldolase [Pseudomonadota bacterium]
MIDLRSDTVTRPTAAMRTLMADAEVGDDVYGEDPTVNELEAKAAAMTGHEAALYVSSGTQGNLLGIMSHCGRGDEYIVGQHAHAYKSEGGGAAVLGSIQPQPLEQRPDGTFDLDDVRKAIKPDDSHYARTALLALENTTQGRALPPRYVEEAAALAREHGLGLHLDGARVFNAAVKTGVSVDAITRQFDTVSICLSKGLGAPMGSVLVGRASFINTARRLRKMVGGGMRQIGIVAAAAVYALDHHVERLADDHSNAKRLADGLHGLNGLSVDTSMVQTNMVFVDTDPDTASALKSHLANQQIIIGKGPRIRLVTHLDIDRDGIDRTVAAMREFFSA